MNSNSLTDTLDFISFDKLLEVLRLTLERAGLAPDQASIIAENCASCERDGSFSHGVFRIEGYVNTLRSGWVDGKAVPDFEMVGPSYLRVDARNGYAQPAIQAASSRISEMVAETGVAVVAVRNSHHFSSLWPDLEPFAQAGFVGLEYVTGGLAVVPQGANRRIFGTNPIAFATPVKDQRPLIVDFATSAMSMGDLKLARLAQRKVTIGTGVGREGKPTDDPGEIEDFGGLLPFGEHKGFALSMMVEILASAMTGGNYSHEVDYSEYPGAQSPNTGVLLVVLDPGRGGNQIFGERVAKLVGLLRRSGVDRLPSDKRYQMRDKALQHGVPVSQAVRKFLDSANS